jgi:hypothetical protein
LNLEHSPNGPWNAWDRCEYPAETFSLGGRRTRASAKSPTVRSQERQFSSRFSAWRAADFFRSQHLLSRYLHFSPTAKSVFCFPLIISSTRLLPEGLG